MSRQTIVAAGIAILVVGAIVASVLYSTRKNKVELTGKVLQVRTHSVDADNTVVFADMRVSNPSTQQFVVQDVAAFLDTGEQEVQGDLFTETDAQRLFSFYPVLGKKHNPNLMIRQKINSGESIDRMISVRFPGTEARVQNRKGLRIVVTDVDGAKTEIREKL